MMARKGAKAPKLAAHIANRVRRKCLDDGGDEKDCDRIAIIRALSIANAPAKEKE